MEHNSLVQHGGHWLIFHLVMWKVQVLAFPRIVTKNREQVLHDELLSILSNDAYLFNTDAIKIQA